MRKTKTFVVAIVCVFAAITFANAEGRATKSDQATQPAALTFTLKPLGHNVYAAIDDAKGDAGANAGFVIGDDGVAVIDTFENPEASKQMLAEIASLRSFRSNLSLTRTITSITSQAIPCFSRTARLCSRSAMCALGFTRRI